VYLKAQIVCEQKK